MSEITTKKNHDKHAIHGYVRSDIRGKFEAYRREIGLTSGSALLTLLILREIELKRLSKNAAISADREPRHLKVSAYVNPVHAGQFKKHVDSLCRSTSDCAADLIERELAERWLEAALRFGAVSR